MQDLNDPDLQPKYLGRISSDFVKVADQLKEAAYLIKKKGFSEYPIFAISKEPNPIGSVLYDREKFKTEWHYNASFLREFEERALIDKEKVEAFKANFKDPEEFCCLFVFDRAFTKFVFIPYPVD